MELYINFWKKDLAGEIDNRASILPILGKLNKISLSIFAMSSLQAQLQSSHATIKHDVICFFLT